MITLAIANNKGGVGKTSTAVHLATGLAKKKERVLLVDLDPQGSATLWLMGRLPEEVRGVADALINGDADTLEASLHLIPNREGLTLMPSTKELRGIDRVLAREVAGVTALKRLLTRVKDRFEYCLIDCPPNLDQLVLSGLFASDSVIVPVLGAFLSIAGLRELEETIGHLHERLNARINILGYVLFASDVRKTITAEARELMKKQAPGMLFRSEIRVSTAAESLPARRETAWDPGSDPRGQEDYSAVLAEALKKLGSPKRVSKR